MRTFWLSLLTGVFLLTAQSTHAAETELSDPKPTMDGPRKVVVSLHTKDDFKVNNLLYNVVNIQKFYGQDQVEIVVIGWGPGVRPLLKSDSKVRARIESLTQYGVTFIICKNTMDTIGAKLDDVIDGVEWVQAGLPDIMERRLRGWIDIWP